MSVHDFPKIYVDTDFGHTRKTAIGNYKHF